MAAGAGLAQCSLYQTVRTVIAVRVMTAAAGHFPLAYRVVGALIELCTLGEVALITHFGLPVVIQHRIICDMNLMAAGAGHVAGLMETAFPFDALVVLVTFQALAVLFLNRRPAVLAEAQYRGPGFPATDTLRMLSTRPVTRLALQARERRAFISTHGMFGFENREHGILIILVMTLLTAIRATPGVVTLIDSLHRGFGGLNGQRVPGFACQ